MTQPHDTELEIALIPDALYLLGGVTEITPQLSWRTSEHKGRFERLNPYLIVEDGQAALIDTGVTANWDLIKRQLSHLLFSKNLTLRAIICTRGEPDCISNLARLTSEFDVTNTVVYAVGGLSPLDFFDDINLKELIERFGVELRILRSGDTVELTPNRVFDIIMPELRTLSTAWVWDRAASTMFSSDTFSHYSAEEPTQKFAHELCTELDQTSFRKHLLTKFDWLPRADVKMMFDQIEQIYNREVVRIAPSRGLVIQGNDLVEENVNALKAALQDIASNQKVIV